MFIVQQNETHAAKIDVYGWRMDTDPKMKEDALFELKIGL